MIDELLRGPEKDTTQALSQLREVTEPNKCSVGDNSQYGVTGAGALIVG